MTTAPMGLFRANGKNDENNNANEHNTLYSTGQTDCSII